MKQVIGWSIALTVAMVGSYLTWTDDSEPPAVEGVAVYRASPSELGSVTWASEKTTVTLTKRSDDLGDYYWIDSLEVRTITRPVEPAEPDESAPEDPPPEPATEEVTEEVRVAFLGNAAAGQVWEGFAPLEALRELTELPGIDREVFGLTEPEGTLTVKKGDTSYEIVVGSETYGSKDRYAAMGDRVFLLDDADLRPLQFASSRLVERQLTPLQPTDMERVTATRPGGPSVELVQGNRDDEARAFWALASNPEEADDDAEAWVARAFLLRFRRYVRDEEAGELEPLFSYAIEGGGQTYEVSFFMSKTDGHAYARSSHNRSLLQLTDDTAPVVQEALTQLAASGG